MLSNVTVIIPAHNRPERLQRLLDYYSSTDIRIIVPDSSVKKFEGRLDRNSTRYFHRPNLHFLLKVNEILPLIDTDYVLYCADDDFAVPEAIDRIVDFLENNKDYTVAQGHYLTFEPRRNKISFTPRYIRNFDCRITSDTPVERLHEKTNGSYYAPLLYGVARTDAFRKIYSYCFDAEGNLRFKNLFLAELFFENAMLILGKYATLPLFFSAREEIPGSATASTTPVSVIKNDPAYKDEYQGYITALAQLLADNSDLSPDDAQKVILEIDNIPTVNASIGFKRRVNNFLQSHSIFAPLAELSRRRYNQKGLKAVQGMTSYPCTFSTPERKAIEDAIRATGSDVTRK